jgi:hypothetical protein
VKETINRACNAPGITSAATRPYTLAWLFAFTFGTGLETLPLGHHFDPYLPLIGLPKYLSVTDYIRRVDGKA